MIVPIKRYSHVENKNNIKNLYTGSNRKILLTASIFFLYTPAQYKTIRTQYNYNKIIFYYLKW